MKYKKIMFMLVLAIFIFGATSVCASDVNDTLIANEDDSSVELSAESNDGNVNILEENDNVALKSTNDQTLLTDGETGSLVELNHEINDNDNTTITLTKNYKYVTGDEAFQFGMDINRTLTINGNGRIIDGSGAASIFKINADHVTITNLTFKNCMAHIIWDNGYVLPNHAPNKENTGGAIKWYGDYGTITHCTFTENHAHNGGGAISCGGDYITVKLCNFKNNIAEEYGGAISVSGDYGTVTESNFTGNKALNGQSGAIQFNHYSNVSQCIFINNTASDNGGAINMGESNNISYCIFIGNKALFTGGAINMYSDSIIAHSIFANNTAEFDGGALFINDLNVLVINSTFAGNSANTGGAIGGYDKDYTKAILSIFDSNINENFDYFTIVPAYLNVNNFTISYNSGEKLLFNLTADNVNYDGYNITIKIYNQTDDLVRTFHALSGDEWIPDLPVGYYHASFDSEYAGFQQINRTITITAPEHTFWFLNYTINGNDNPVIELSHDFYFDPAYDAAFVNGIVINRPVTIKGNGNAIDAKRQARIFYVQSANAVLENLTIINANSVGDGGAIYFSSSATSGTVTNCNFTGNTASGDGGAIRMYSGTVSNCNFTNNSARYGGVIKFERMGIVTKCNFTNSQASIVGGAIFFNDYSTGNVINCNFTNNQASSGGAIEFGGSGSVTNCSFTDNTAVFGGTIEFGGSGSVTNCNFVNNTASEWGGAISMGSGTVSNCNFTGNNATGDGGAIRMSSGTVTNCNFVNNSATGGNSWGGAINIYSGNVTNCTFTDNTATGDGGAVYFINTGNVTNCTFTDNTARYGGAVYFSTGTVANCTFTDNTASYNGGAVHFDETGTVTNCNFTGNNATYGSAIFFNSYGYAKTISNSIFLNNLANAESLEIIKNDNNITITFKGKDNLLNAIHSFDDVNFANVTYWGANGITNTDSSTPSRSKNEAGQNITVGVVVNGKVVLNEVNVTDDNGMIVLDISAGDNYYITARHDADSYYTEAEKTISNNTKFNVNVTSKTTNNKTVNITAKSNIPQDVVQGKLLFIVPNSDSINATYAGNGTWWTVYTFGDYGDYQVNATYSGLDNVTVNNATISISKTPTEITLVNETVNLFVGNSINSGAALTPAVGNLTFTSNNESVAKVENGNIIAVGEGSAVVTVSFAGSDNYAPAKNKTISVTVNFKDASVSVNNDTLDLLVGDEFAIVATTTPEGLNVSFVPDDSGVYSIDENGNVIALRDGDGSILVKVGGDGIYALNSTIVNVTVSKVPTEITVLNDTLVLEVGDEIAAGATLTPGDAGNLTYSISNSSVVKVENGKIIALAEGEATITVSFEGDNKYLGAENKTINVTVSKIPTNISVNTASLDLFVGDEVIIVATLTPADAGNVTFKSSDEDLVLVEDDGNVIANGKGQANITVSFAGNDKYAAVNKTINVTVKLNNANVTVDKDKLDLKVGESYTINATRHPDTILLDITYTSSNTSVASVDKNGIVRAVGEGTAIITLSVGDDEIYAKNSTNITVTVKKSTPKLTANAKTFKNTDKTKKYTVSLKNSKGKPIANAQVSLKVNGKTYTAKTNSKGQATFKLTKLTKTGTYTATVKYAGDKKHAAVSAKAKITVKSTWKTIAKGSNYHSMVKKIQIALKNKGYYQTYNGHYLKVDGIFNTYTEMAVMQFQKASGLKVTGKVDYNTAKKLGITK